MLKVFYNQARVKPLTSSSSSAQDCLSFCSQCLSAVIVWHFQAYINHCVGQALLFCRNSYKTWQGSHQNQVLSPKRIAGFCSQHPQLWQVSEYPQNVSWCKTCAVIIWDMKMFFWASLSEFESRLTMTKYLPIFIYLFGEHDCFPSIDCKLQPWRKDMIQIWRSKFTKLFCIHMKWSQWNEKRSVMSPFMFLVN